MDLNKAYEYVTTQWSDVQANIPAIEQHVKDVDAKTIIELGVRSGVSTVVFLHALRESRPVGVDPDNDCGFEDVQFRWPGELWSVDVNWPSGPLLPALNQPNWVFTHGDDLDPGLQLPTADVDLVFIDTIHQYEHTYAELVEYEPRLRDGGRFLLHDTELEHPETAPDDDPFPVRRAAERFAGEVGYEFVNDPTGYGLGCIYV